MPEDYKYNCDLLLRELIKERDTAMENSLDTEFDSGFLQGIDACIEKTKQQQVEEVKND